MSEMLQKENQEKTKMMWGREGMMKQVKNSLIISAGCKRILRPQRMITPTKRDPGKGQKFGIAEHLEGERYASRSPQAPAH